MKYLKLKKYLALLVSVAFVFSACKKIKVAEPMGDAGQTLVKAVGGGTPASIKKNPVDFVPTPTKITGADIRRDIPNNSELNKTMNVVVKDDTAAVTAANPAYIKLPISWYQIEIGGVVTSPTAQGLNYNLTLKPGEFAKEINIIIPNATLMNPSALYALGFTITSVDAGGKISTQKSVVVEIGAKNNWDGVYENIGPGFLDITNAAFTYGGDQQYSLITVGASTCVVWNDDLNSGFPGYVFSNAGAGTYYGAYGLIISFNPATNAVANLWNYYGDPSFPDAGGQSTSTGTGPPLYESSNTRRAVLDPSGVNAVQGNKDILIKHWLVQRSVVTTPPNIRSYFDETWQYLGPR